MRTLITAVKRFFGVPRPHEFDVEISGCTVTLDDPQKTWLKVNNPNVKVSIARVRIMNADTVEEVKNANTPIE